MSVVLSWENDVNDSVLTLCTNCLHISLTHTCMNCELTTWTVNSPHGLWTHQMLTSVKRKWVSALFATTVEVVAADLSPCAVRVLLALPLAPLPPEEWPLLQRGLRTVVVTALCKQWLFINSLSLSLIDYPSMSSFKWRPATLIQQLKNFPPSSLTPTPL